jgi:heme/copper-type cytochrome/quinol oxidase subunit 1
MGENNTPGKRQPSKRAKLPAAVVPFLGLAAALGGCLVAYLNRDFTGWFAYAPLSNQPFTANGAAFITQGTQLGLALAVVGLLLLAFWAGLVAGRRTGSRRR